MDCGMRQDYGMQGLRNEDSHAELRMSPGLGGKALGLLDKAAGLLHAGRCETITPMRLRGWLASICLHDHGFGYGGGLE